MTAGRLGKGMRFSRILQWLQPHRENNTAAEKDVMVFGAGRSGTTWLAQIIAAGGLGLIFEPLHPEHVPEADTMKPLPLILRKTDVFQFQDLFARLVRGDVRNSWVIRENPAAERKVVKLIRANLWMEWILEHHDVQPVFIFRNPLSVVASMVEQGWKMPAWWVQFILTVDKIRDPFLFDLPDAAALATEELSEKEIFAVFWCIQNLLPARMGLLESMPVIFYEELCAAPEKVVEDLAPRIQLPLTKEVWSACRKPSFMRGRRSGEMGYDPMTAWRQVLSDDDVERITRIVKAFGLDEHLKRVV